MTRRFGLMAGVAATIALGATQVAGAHDGGALDLTDTGAHAQLIGLEPSDAFAPLGAFSDNVTYSGGDNGFTGGHVAIQGKRLYLGSYGRGLRIYDIKDDPGDPRLIGQYTPGLRADAPPDAWEHDGRQFAVLNGTNRTHASIPPSDARTDRTEFLDTTDPANPKLLWTFGPDQIDGESHNGDVVDKRLLYLPSGGRTSAATNNQPQGLRIYDLRPLMGETAQPPANLFRGDPTKMWEASPYRNGKPVGPAFTHTHDISVYTDRYVEGMGNRDIALLAEGGNYTGNGNTGSVFVIDITDPRNPVVLLRWLHESGPSHHPIRYHHEAQFLDGDPSVMLVTDEDMHNGCGNAGGITAVRLSANLQSATELSEWFIPLGTPAPVCSVHVFDSKGPNVYVGSYNAGLQIVSYRDPANPRQVGEFIAPGTTAWGAEFHRDYVYVGDMTRGLDVFRHTP